MKLYISENIDKAIAGFTLIPIAYGEIDLSSIPSNCASEIVAIDAIDKIPHDKIELFVANLCSKIRLNGIVHFGGLDAYALSRNLLSGNIDIKQYSEIISNNDAIYSSKYILDLLRKYNLSVKSVVYKGHYYEITAQRTYNQN